MKAAEEVLIEGAAFVLLSVLLLLMLHNRYDIQWRKLFSGWRGQLTGHAQSAPR